MVWSETLKPVTMILINKNILEAKQSKDIIIKPFIRKFLGPTSYDLHLARTLSFFGTLETFHDFKEHGTRYALRPGDFVLGCSLELIGVPTGKYEGRIDGTSSLGRAGIATHITASKLNPGHTLHITMEIKNVSNENQYLYWGMPIGQITFEELKEPVDVTNLQRSYGNPDFQLNPMPQKSKLIEKTKEARDLLKKRGFLK